jgi:hypothetical protein
MTKRSQIILYFQGFSPAATPNRCYCAARSAHKNAKTNPLRDDVEQCPAARRRTSAGMTTISGCRNKPTTATSPAFCCARVGFHFSLIAIQDGTKRRWQVKENENCGGGASGARKSSRNGFASRAKPRKRNAPDWMRPFVQPGLKREHQAIAIDV